MKLVIGLVGKNGSGKTTVSKRIQDNYGGKEHRFSQILMDILDRLYLPHERTYLQKLGKSLRAELGPDVIANAFKKDLEKEFPQDNNFWRAVFLFINSFGLFFNLFSFFMGSKN